MLNSTEPQLQSSLGRVAKNSTKAERSWNNGYFVLGKILKVHHKRNTADVSILQSSDVIMSDVKQEGKYSCRIGVGLAGVDEEFGEPYGEVIPLQKGMIVLVAFLKNTKQKPVIIKVFHDTTEDIGNINLNNILPSEYPITNPVEMYRYLNINRVQDVFTIDGTGNLEISSHTKSFFTATLNDIDAENFDYEDLHTKNKRNGKTVYIPERRSFPFKYLAVFRDNYNDKETNWLKLFIDATKTSFKLAKMNQLENNLTALEIDENGAIKVRRQLDSNSWSGNNSNKYSEISLEQNGDIEVTFKGTKTTTIKVSESGVDIDTENSITMKSKSDITLSGNSINLDGVLISDCDNTASDENKL